METGSCAQLKQELRTQMRAAAEGLPIQRRKAQDKALFKAFLGLEQVKQAKTILVFWGVGTEPETTGLISALLASGKRVALPRCLPGRGMEARLYRGERVTRNAYGIPEPGEACPPVDKGELDVILVPALCYDKAAYRLGQGGGYYDRYLADYAGFTVGLCYRELLRDALPLEPHDRPVRLLLTA